MNMEEKEDKKGGFFSNWIVRNVLLAVLFFAVLIFVSSMLLSVLTNHGKAIEVPDYTSTTVNEAKHEASRSKLRVEVIDSIFVRKMERGAIYSQNPKPGSQVKQGEGSSSPSTPRMPRRSACRILSAIQCVKPRQN